MVGRTKYNLANKFQHVMVQDRIKIGKTTTAQKY